MLEVSMLRSDPMRVPVGSGSDHSRLVVMVKALVMLRTSQRSASLDAVSSMFVPDWRPFPPEPHFALHAMGESILLHVCTNGNGIQLVSGHGRAVNAQRVSSASLVTVIVKVYVCGLLGRPATGSRSCRSRWGSDEVI